MSSVVRKMVCGTVEVLASCRGVTNGLNVVVRTRNSSPNVIAMFPPREYPINSVGSVPYLHLSSRLVHLVRFALAPDEPQRVLLPIEWCETFRAAVCDPNLAVALQD